MSKKRIMIALLALMFVSNIALGISPSVAKIGLAFPEVSRSTLQMILSLAAFSSFGASLVVGKVQQYVSQKTVILSGAVLLSLGALPLVISTSFPFLLVVSVIIGLGSGSMTATAPALISTYFTGDERSSMLGKNTSLKYIGSMTMTSLGGTLAVYGWQFNYAIFLFALIGLAVGIVLLPNDRKNKKEEAEETTKETQEQVENENQLKLTSPSVLIVITLGVTITLMSAATQNNLAIHAQELKIGDTSIAGLALACQSLGSIVAGFFITSVSKILKRHTLFVGYISMAIGHGIVATVHVPIALFIGCFFVGLSVGSVMTRILYLMTSVVRPSAIPVTASIFSAATSLGFALSPLLFNPIAGMISSSLATTSFFIATCMAVCLVALLGITQFEQRLLKKIN